MVNFSCFLSSTDFFFQKILSVSKSLDPDQAQNFAGPDLGPKCLRRLSADDARRQRLKLTFYKSEQIKCQKIRGLHSEK